MAPCHSYCFPGVNTGHEKYCDGGYNHDWNDADYFSGKENAKLVSNIDSVVVRPRSCHSNITYFPTNRSHERNKCFAHRNINIAKNRSPTRFSLSAPLQKLIGRLSKPKKVIFSTWRVIWCSATAICVNQFKSTKPARGQDCLPEGWILHDWAIWGKEQRLVRIR